MSLPIIDEGRWARMSWQARQDWLLAATALRRQLAAELEALAKDDRARVAHMFGRKVERDLLVAEGALSGPERLAEVEQAARDWGGWR